MHEGAPCPAPGVKCHPFTAGTSAAHGLPPAFICGSREPGSEGRPPPPRCTRGLANRRELRGGQEKGFSLQDNSHVFLAGQRGDHTLINQREDLILIYNDTWGKKINTHTYTLIARI